MCGENICKKQNIVSNKKCLKKSSCGASKTEESLERTLRSIEDLSFEKISLEITSLSTYVANETERSIIPVFERYLICVFRLKRELKRLGRNEFSNETLLSLESKVFYEYFPMVSLQEKVDATSRILKARVLFELEPSTMISLLEQGVDVSHTKNCYREGLLIWEGSWLHNVVCKGGVLRREWFANVDDTCVCEKEHITESILDHALHANTSWEVKFYNIVLSIAMGCNLLNAEIDEQLLPLLSWSVQNVNLTQQFALSLLCKRLPHDLVYLVATYYNSDLTAIIKALEASKGNF